MLKRLFLVLLLTTINQAQAAQAPASIKIEVTVPKLNVNPYHRPYVAVWLETEKRGYVTTIALWGDDMEWYKDLRQWWRKAGRSQQPYDGVTGATKRPGKHSITWLGKDAYGKTIAAGTYLLNVEASREEGGREFLRTKITINQQGELTLQGKTELGLVRIRQIN